MNSIVLCKSVLIFVAIWSLAVADSDTRTVAAEFDRCSAAMERFERSLRRYEDAVDAIKRNVAKPGTIENESVSREAAALENRLEYFRNRFERARGQSDKIRSDLKNVSGPTCPSCIESSVNMYCRNSETMQNDIDEYLIKAADLQSSPGTTESTGKESAPVERNISFGQRRLEIDSLYRSTADCNDRAGVTLRDQAGANISRADSLFACNETTSALKALNIAASLVKKAAVRCEGSK